MKVTETEWQFDRKKLNVYFTAEKRVDFRALVRDLARAFRTRIELKQIGVRDEAAMLGGVGRCGRELCCSTWLPELKPVSCSWRRTRVCRSSGPDFGVLRAPHVLPDVRTQQLCRIAAAVSREGRTLKTAPVRKSVKCEHLQRYDHPEE